MSDSGFSIDDLGEDAAEQALHHLALLEKSLGSAHDPAEGHAFMDEAYRAAHSLKAAIDSRRMPNVDRLARRVQDVVRATRSGALAVTPQLASMLASVARVARDALESISGGKAEPASASSAAAVMEEMLSHPGAWTPASSGARMVWARVEAARLIAAGEAAGEARAAASAFAGVAHASAEAAGMAQAALERHGREMKALLEALPAGLARAARGEPTTAIAADLVALVSALGVTASQLEQALSQNSSAVREAAARGTRAAEMAEAALGSIRSVRLDAVLDDLPRIVRRLAKKSGRPVEIVLQAANLEVHAVRAEKVNALVKTCLRALIGLPSPRGRSARGKAPAHLSVVARSAGEDLHLRYVIDGLSLNKEQLKAALETARERLQPGDGTLETDGRKGEGEAILLVIHRAAAPVTRSREFVVARAGEAWYAIPAPSVVECIEANMSMPDYVQDGVRLPTMRMNDTRNPRVGVVVKTPRGGVVLLFDVVGGREMAVMNTGGGAELLAGISGSVRRPDGTRALLVDLEALLPAP